MNIGTNFSTSVLCKHSIYTKVLGQMREKGNGKTNYEIGKYFLKFQDLKSGISSQPPMLSYFVQTYQ